MVDDVVGNLAAAVESLGDYGGVLVYLRVVITIEIGVTALGRVRKINVRHAAAGHLVDFAPILFDPGEVAQALLVANGHHGDFARSGSVRIWPNLKHSLFADRPLEEAQNI